jgi:two-component system chemotaxis response regulator CheY
MTSNGNGAAAGLRVLVVDDSPIMRKMVIHSLKVAGIEVATMLQASHGAEALATIDRDQPELVLCDVHMPTMDGAELVRTLAEQGRLAVVPVVMISSERNDAQQSELERLGVRAYLHKPFYPEALGKVVREVLALEEAS